MSLLYPYFLTLLLPLFILIQKEKKDIFIFTHLIILILLILTLSRPVLQKRLQKSAIEAKTIIIALDVSYSMHAKDTLPNRYIFSKKVIQSLLKLRPTDNIMLIAFTSNPLILSPPTTDHQLIKVALESLNPNNILTKGTSLKKLFQFISSFEEGYKSLLLITDGGEENKVNEITKFIKKSDITLHILALGTQQGITIEKPDGSLVKNKNGDLIISRVNPILQVLASFGTYTQASSSHKATALLLHQKIENEALKQKEIEKLQKEYHELYQYPLFLATILFLLLHTRGIRYLMILFSLFSFNLQASFLDPYYLHLASKNYYQKDFNQSLEYIKRIQEHSLEKSLLMAHNYYKTQQFKDALKTYQSIKSKNRTLKQSLYYNIANTYVKLGKYRKAKKHYLKALALGFDEASQKNLEKIYFLEDKKEASLGIAHPKSQNESATKSQQQKEEEKEKREEDNPSSGSGSGGEKTKTKSKKRQRLIDDKTRTQQPLSSKAYDIINKGYIYEKNPW